MSKSEKLLIVLLMGSIWGALELFGIDIMRTLHVPSKSAFLFGLGIIVLYASKRLVDFKGSVVIMALIAGLFKTVSSSFFACQFAAVMINGIIFDITYSTLKSHLDSSQLFRLISAPIITYVCYTIFAFTATYVIQEPHWAARGMAGIGDYLMDSAVVASLITIVTINLGYYLGNAMKPILVPGRIGLPAVAFRVSAVVLVAAIWIAGQMY